MDEPLSSIASRPEVLNKLEEFVEQHKDCGSKFAILLIKVNRLRQINTSYGIKVGDLLLQEFTDRLVSNTRDQDYIGRMGSSEFIVVLSDVLNEGHAILAALKYSGSLKEPFDLGENRLNLTSCIGISLFPEHANDIQRLIQTAEMALDEASCQEEAYSVYSSESGQIELNSWDVEFELSNAIARDEFELYFQPQICLQTGQIFGSEALIRWNHSEKGYIRSDFFIPIAERSGQITEITWWAINAALRSMRDWPKTGIALNVAVNVSAKILERNDLLDSIANSVSIWGAAFENLTLEITESVLMVEKSTTYELLNRLRTLGLNISIDDFGTGYSSMSYFKNIPANELKIDKTFVINMLDNEMDKHIVKTVIRMAHGFNLKVVAEGVENLETYELLKELGCDVVQGYYLAKPMPNEDFVKWINEYQAAR